MNKDLFGAMILVGVILFGIISRIIIYHWARHGEQTLKYKEFKAIFPVAKEKWYRPDSYCCFVYDGAHDIYMRTYLEWLLAKHLYNKNKNNILERKLNKEKELLLEKWQRDAKEYKEKEIKEIIEDLQKYGVCCTQGDVLKEVLEKLKK